MYNVCVKRFADGDQIQIFSEPLRSSGEYHCPQFDRDSGEIIYNFRGKLTYVPFEDDLVPVHDMQGAQVSAQKSYLRTKKAVYDLSRSNRWEWFVTFTFAPDVVDRYDYCAVSRLLVMWLNHSRRVAPDMVYLVVPEMHKDGAYHFHGLFACCDGLCFVDSGHVDRAGRTVYNVGRYKYGFTTATRISDTCKASAYLVKYISKDLCAVSKGRRRYWVSKNAKRPEVYRFLFSEGSETALQFFSPGVTWSKSLDNDFVSVCYLECATLPESVLAGLEDFRSI